MRRTLPVCRNGLSVAVAVVLLSACGGSDEETSGSAASSGTGSATAEATAESSAAAADAQFCTDAADIQDGVSSTLNDPSNPAALQQALQQAATEIRDVEPPAEIASDWDALADGVERIAAAFASVDINNPDALAAFQQEAGQLQAQLSTASTNISNYLRTECGVDSDASEPAAPSS